MFSVACVCVAGCPFGLVGFPWVVGCGIDVAIWWCFGCVCVLGAVIC